MAKIDNEIIALKKEIVGLRNDINQTNFNVLRILSDIQKIGGQGIATLPDGETGGSRGAVTVDLGPIEERLEELTKNLMGKQDLEVLGSKVDKIASNRIKQAEDTVKRVTRFLQTGLEMVKIEATLEDVKSLLEEIIVQEK